MKKRTGAILALIILLLPVAILLFMKSGKNKYIELPIYDEVYKNKMDSLESVFVGIESITGEKFLLDSLLDKIYVVSNTSLPYGFKNTKSNINLRRVYSFFGRSKDFKVIQLLSSNKATDVDVDSLLSSNKNKPQWYILRNIPDTSSHAIEILSNDYYKISHISNATDTFQLISLVDKQGRTRGMYNLLNKKDNEKLMDEIRLLLVQDANNRK